MHSKFSTLLVIAILLAGTIANSSSFASAQTGNITGTNSSSFASAQTGNITGTNSNGSLTLTMPVPPKPPTIPVLPKPTTMPIPSKPPTLLSPPKLSVMSDLNKSNSYTISKIGPLVTFTAAKNGDWNTGSTWVGGIIPGTSDNKIIPSGINVTITSEVDNYGTITNSGGITISNSGTSSFGLVNVGNLNNSGIITVLNIGSSTGIFSSGVITNSGTIKMSNTGYIGIDSNGEINNNLGGQIMISNTGTFGIYNRITFTNSGTITISNTGPSTYGIDNVGGPFTNNSGGQVTISNSGTNSRGIYNVNNFTNSGTIMLSNSGTTSYGIENDVGQVAYAFTNTSGGIIMISNSGTSSGIYIKGSSTTFSNNSGGQITVSNIGTYGIIIWSGIITNSGVINVSNTGDNSIGIDNGVNITNNLGGQITVSNTGTTSDGIYNAIGITNSGTITISNTGPGSYGIDNVNGPFTNNSGGQVTISNSGTSFSGIFNYNAQFTNNYGGHVTISNTGQTAGIYNDGGFVTSYVFNFGIITVSNSGTWGIVNYSVLGNDSGGQIMISNTGTIGIDNQYYGGFDNYSGGQITISNIAFGSYGIYNNSLLQNAGTIKVSNSNLSYGIDNAADSFVNLSGGTLTVSNSGTSSVGIYNSGGIHNSGGQITVSNSGGTGISNNISYIYNSGAITVASTSGYGIINNGGNLANSGTITVSNASSSYGIYNGSILQGIITNYGIIAISNASNLYGIYNDAKSIITNYSGGQITVSNTRGTGIYNGNTLTNSGTISNFGTISNSGIANNVGTLSNLGTISNPGTINMICAGMTGNLVSGNPITNTCSSSNDAGTVYFTTSSGLFSNVTALTEASQPTTGKPTGTTLPFGVFSFNVTGVTPGSTQAINMTFPTQLASDTQYWKIQGGTWVNATLHISIVNDGYSVLLSITDGGFGDSDGLANGNIADPGAVVIYDPELPTLAILSPANNTSSITSAVTVSGTASDNVAVSAVTWKVDSGTVSVANGTTSWSFTTPALNNGLHTIFVNATDTSGNTVSQHLGITIVSGTLAATISPSNPLMGKGVQYAITITTATTSAISDIKITFPPTSAVGIAKITPLAGMPSGGTGGTTTVSGQTVTYTLPTPQTIPAGTTIFLYISKLQNPVTYGDSTVSITTENPPGTPIDTVSGVQFFTQPLRTPNTHVAQGNILTTLDTTASNTGQHTSTTVGMDDMPVISYYDATNGFLKVAHCSQQDCARGATIATVDNTANNTGQYSSIAIGTDGLPVISYYDGTNFHLKVAHCGSSDCSSGNTLTTVDSGAGNDTGQYSSIAIGTDGFPVISYSDETNGHLKVAHCGVVDCTSGNTLTTADNAALTGQYSSITIGTDGNPVISYYDGTNLHLKVAHCVNIVCTSSGLTTVDNVSGNNTGQYSSITLGTDNLPVISYYDATNGNLKAAHCGSVDCTSGNTITTVDSGDLTGQYSSITISTDGNPVVSYYDNTNGQLKVAHCGNLLCSSGTITTTVDSGALTGQYSSIIIGTDGLPLVGYYDSTNGHLKVVHCANNICVPNWTRR